MNDAFIYISVFLGISILLWIAIGMRELLIAAKKISEIRDSLDKLLSKRQSLIPGIIISAKRVSEIPESMISGLINARSSAMKEREINGAKIEAEMSLSHEINKFLEYCQAQTDIKKSGFFLEYLHEIEYIENKTEKASNVYSKAVMEYNARLEKKWFLVSAFLSRAKRKNIFEFEM